MFKLLHRRSSRLVVVLSVLSFSTKSLKGEIHLRWGRSCCFTVFVQSVRRLFVNNQIHSLSEHTLRKQPHDVSVMSAGLRNNMIIFTDSPHYNLRRDHPSSTHRSCFSDFESLPPLLLWHFGPTDPPNLWKSRCLSSFKPTDWASITQSFSVAVFLVCFVLLLSKVLLHLDMVA